MSLEPLGTRRPDFRFSGYGTNQGIVFKVYLLKTNEYFIQNAEVYQEYQCKIFVPFRHEYTEMQRNAQEQHLFWHHWCCRCRAGSSGKTNSCSAVPRVPSEAGGCNAVVGAVQGGWTEGL